MDIKKKVKEWLDEKNPWESKFPDEVWYTHNAIQKLVSDLLDDIIPDLTAEHSAIVDKLKADHLKEMELQRDQDKDFYINLMRSNNGKFITDHSMERFIDIFRNARIDKESDQ